MKRLIFLIFFISIPAFADFDDRLKQLELERKINDIERKVDWERREQRSRQYMRDYEERREKSQREIDEIIDESNRTRFELEMQHRLNELKE
jgi:F0F1-type ATP synthase membrane subunit b/b'